jgi:hypothetical protein
MKTLQQRQFRPSGNQVWRHLFPFLLARRSELTHGNDYEPHSTLKPFIDVIDV